MGFETKTFQVRILLLLLGISILAIALFNTNYHDYIAYVKQWRIISDGGNPYLGKASDNAYGIIYNLFAYLHVTDLVAVPRGLWILFYFFTISKLCNFISHQNPEVNLTWLKLFLLVNPLFLIFGVKYGSNDVFLSSLVLLGIILYLEKKSLLSGIIIAIAVGFKFVPLLIIPFLIFNNNLKIDYKFLCSSIITITLIYFMGYLEWGNGIIRPLVLGTERVSKIFSIFRFLKANGINLDSYSTILVISGAIGSFLAYVIFKLDRTMSILFCWLNILLLYKVGHPQFYLTPILLSTLIYGLNKQIIKRSPFVCICFLTLGLWMFFWSFYYDQIGLSPRLRDWIGLPHTIILLTANIWLLKLGFAKRNLVLKKYASENSNSTKALEYK
ncbi:glycosyltransferase family 87 protein [Flagellimonas olearia]|uniref:DUF2029 domain-containing protein n=1 Tax=Flagellimonas olearia TaxID=552546 RepID=A0A444VLA3_9FLAO|nr:glycosyltransferase family 87 protein [Allomuricauda olearia]RYC51565.1 hypothetical protein DN53_12055 [Allomuricauda olearia]